MEASPICRGKNLTLETVMAFVNAMPKERMQKKEFHAIAESKLKGWTQTHSQIARQLALYYEDNGYCIPRFCGQSTSAIVFEYIRRWASLYYVPNLYTPSLIGYPPTNIYAYLRAKINEGETSFSKACTELFGISLNNTDKVRVYLNNFTDLVIEDDKLSRNTGIKNSTIPTINPTIADINDAKLFYNHFGNTIISTSMSQNKSFSALQQIFYGAPGTGKSHEIKKLTKGESVIRTTFHPDSDYSTFVGAYKPTMTEKEVRLVPVVVNNGISLNQNQGTYTETQITYRFVIQAFLKAYLKAWKQYADGKGDSVSSYVIEETQPQKKQRNKDITVKVDRVVLVYNTSMADAGRQILAKYIDLVKANKSVDDIIKDWNDSMALGGLFKLTRVENTTSNWEKFLVINEDCYFYAGINGKDWPTFCERVKELFNSLGHQIEITKATSPSQTTNDAVSNDNDPTLFAESSTASDEDNSETTTTSPVFLIIEEINRGNCAQIFGDIFQLLDRQNNGFSEYPIEADTDLQQEIERAFNEPGEYRLDNDIDVDGVVENYTSNYNASLSEDIQHGRILLLPSNLYIWATMNTSDQSLFPIDSAFKRRWEWKYMPINNHEDKGYQIEIGNAKYDWWGFLARINHVINDATNSEDKKLGYFFAKAQGKTIDAEQFVGKVLFYLWNDVFKSYGFDDPIFSKGDNKKFEFSDFFMNDGHPNTDTVNLFLRKLEETIKMEGLPLEIIIDKQNETQPDSEPQEDEA